MGDSGCGRGPQWVVSEAGLVAAGITSVQGKACVGRVHDSEVGMAAPFLCVWEGRLLSVKFCFYFSIFSTVWMFWSHTWYSVLACIFNKRHLPACVVCILGGEGSLSILLEGV